MRWPPPIPDDLGDADVRLTRFTADDAPGLFAALNDPRAWEHIPRQVPATADDLAATLTGRMADGGRIVFTIRRGPVIVGTTSLIFHASDPDGVEIGATQLDPAVWGTGLNGAAKAVLIGACFDAGAAWIQFRTDERNGRSAAAIRKLGAREIGTRQDTLVRRDGSIRRSRFFRLDAPA